MVNEAPAHELLLEDAHLRTFILRAAKRDSPSTAACTLIQNGRLTRPVFAPDVVRVLKLLLPQLRPCVSGKGVQTSRLRTPRWNAEDRGKARGDVFGVLDFWAG